jgi:hypothetical protein
MSKVSSQVKAFVAACKANDFAFEVTGNNTVRITAQFHPGDKEAFTKYDMYAPDVLALAPLRGGSVWGTDGGSVGGHVALTSGRFVMNKSGTAKLFLAELRAAAG